MVTSVKTYMLLDCPAMSLARSRPASLRETRLLLPPIKKRIDLDTRYVIASSCNAH